MIKYALKVYVDIRKDVLKFLFKYPGIRYVLGVWLITLLICVNILLDVSIYVFIIYNLLVLFFILTTAKYFFKNSSSVRNK